MHSSTPPFVTGGADCLAPWHQRTKDKSNNSMILEHTINRGLGTPMREERQVTQSHVRGQIPEVDLGNLANATAVLH